MPKPPENPRFSVISGDGTGLDPPAGLGEAGRTFWRRVQAEYGITDLGGLALLEEICGAKDRLKSLTDAINTEGRYVILVAAHCAVIRICRPKSRTELSSHAASNGLAFRRSR